MLISGEGSRLTSRCALVGGRARSACLLLTGRRPAMTATTRRDYLGIGAALGAGLLAAACDIAPAGAPQDAQDSQDRPAVPKRPDPGLPRQTQRQVPIRVRYTTGEGYGAAWNMNQFRQYTAPFTEAHPHLAIEWQTWSEIPGMYQAFRDAVTSRPSHRCIPGSGYRAGALVGLGSRPVGHTGGVSRPEPVHPARPLRPLRLLARVSGVQHLAWRTVRAAYQRGYATGVL